MSIVGDHAGHPDTALHIRVGEDVPAPQPPPTHLSLLSITNHGAFEPHLGTIPRLAIVQQLTFVLTTYKTKLSQSSLTVVAAKNTFSVFGECRPHDDVSFVSGHVPDHNYNSQLKTETLK